MTKQALLALLADIPLLPETPVRIYDRDTGGYEAITRVSADAEEIRLHTDTRVQEEP